MSEAYDQYRAIEAQLLTFQKQGAPYDEGIEGPMCEDLARLWYQLDPEEQLTIRGEQMDRWAKMLKERKAKHGR